VNAYKQIKRRIEANPDAEEARIFLSLAFALENAQRFTLHKLYVLDDEDFGLAIRLIKEWRKDNHQKSRQRLRETVSGTAYGRSFA
jgi:hypothetical protein